MKIKLGVSTFRTPCEKVSAPIRHTVFRDFQNIDIPKFRPKYEHQGKKSAMTIIKIQNLIHLQNIFFSIQVHQGRDKKKNCGFNVEF